MKKKFILMISIVALFACESDTTENGTSKTTSEKTASVLVDYKLNPTESKADWERTLDQKPTKQKVKLFGNMVDVDLGAVTLNSNGNVTITEGGLITTDNTLTEATVIFDMATFKLAKEKKNGLFDVTKHPNSTLILTEISDSTANGKLTIQGVSSETDVHVTTKKIGSGYQLKGYFVVNTLDFPLRDKVTAKDINKDEIKVIFDLTYGSNK